MRRVRQRREMLRDLGGKNQKHSLKIHGPILNEYNGEYICLDSLTAKVPALKIIQIL